MREILFRGKRVDNGEWHEGLLTYNFEEFTAITNQKRNEQYPSLMDCFTEEVIPATVGQYTGLKDKNGKKIFEGDIIHTLYANCKKNELVEEVEFFNGSFMAKKYSLYAKIAGAESPKHFEFDKSVYMIECEVIGNIHDNPELLSGGANDER